MRRTKASTRRSLLASFIERGPMLTPLIDIMFLVLIFFMINNSPAQRSLAVLPPYMPSAPAQGAESSRETGNSASKNKRGKEEQILFIAVRTDFGFTLQLQSQKGQDLRILQQWQRDSADKEELLVSLQEELQQLQYKQQVFVQIDRIRLRADHRLSYGTVIAICDLLYPWQLPLDLDVSEL